MSFEDDLARPATPVRAFTLPPQQARELDACTAIDRLDAALRALRMAFQAANDAPGTLGLPDEHSKRGEACELRARWVAASVLLHGAINAVDEAGAGTISSVKTMLAIE
jgi:hypothetical protein